MRSLQQMGRVGLQMKADGDLPESFRATIARGLIVIETAIAEKRWENAQQQAAQVQVIWDRWRQWRSDWLKQIEYKTTQLDKCLKQEIAPDTVYGRALKVSLERLTNQMATCETPEVWRGQLGEVQEQIVFYQKVRADLDKLGEQWDVVGMVDSEAAQGWNKVEFLDQLDELKPTDEAGKSQLKAAIAEAKQKSAEAIRDLGAAAMAGQVGARGVSRASGVVGEPPSLSSSDPDRIVRVASAKLRLFRIAGQAIALLMLTGAGFQQLYAGNVTFGAGERGLLSLLGWGFGAEVTRDSVTEGDEEDAVAGV
ncbi:MAG: hypothetical protein HC860_23970 [Alkalinema sp. RU_4_3]|nr:hypothetical protein [Alkalinema sp. RU_4_3]